MIVECQTCEARVDAESLHNYEHYDPEEGGPPALYSFLRCRACGSPFLVVQENYGRGWDDAYRLYPADDTRVNPALPKAIRDAYAEALACFKAKAYTAAALMCRKTLEGVCSEHGVSGRPLVSAIKEMRDNGVIEGRLFEWADALRIGGNEAAHDVTVTVSKQDAADMIQFTNALLEYVLTFRDRFEEFKKRRAKSRVS